jgi:hypothetical protein
VCASKVEIHFIIAVEHARPWASTFDFMFVIFLPVFNRYVLKVCVCVCVCVCVWIISCMSYADGVLK